MNRSEGDKRQKTDTVSDVLKRLQSTVKGITISRKAKSVISNRMESTNFVEEDTICNVSNTSNDEILSESQEIEVLECEDESYSENDDTLESDPDHDEDPVFIDLDDDEDIEEALYDPDYEPSKRSTSPVEKSPANTQAKNSRKPTDKDPSSKVLVVKMEAPPVYICMMCKEKFSSFEPLKDHMKNNSKCKQVQLKCEVCGKMWETKKALYQHSMVHKDKPTFVCEQCGKTFTNRFNLENHKSSKHGEYVEEHGNIYKCKVCDNQFTSRKDLYDHISNHAKTPVTLLCDTCGKSFTSVENLRSHMRIHQNIRPFACTYCPKRFRSRLQLTQHLHVHTGIKPFTCTLCNKAFAKKDSLVAHNRTHTGELPYQCPVCPERFASISKRKTHVKVHSQDACESVCNVLEDATTSYITYSTTFIGSNNILVFENPTEEEEVDQMDDGFRKCTSSTLEIIQ